MKSIVKEYTFPATLHAIATGIMRLLAMIFFSSLVSFGQSNFIPFTRLEIKTGLPGINVRKITKDKYGFMWFATQDGLSRFDGRSYINLNSYNVDQKRKIFGTDIYDVEPDLTQNYLWALTSYGGLNKIDLTTCNVAASYDVIKKRDTSMSLWYKCLAENKQYLVIGTNEGIICYFNKSKNKSDRLIRLSAGFGIRGDLEDLLIDKHGRIWYLVSKGGILITDSTSRMKHGFISESQLHADTLIINDYSIYKDQLLLATSHGIKVIDMVSMKPVEPTSPDFPFSSSLDGINLDCISVQSDVALLSGAESLFSVDLTSKNIRPLRLAGDYEDRAWIRTTNSIYLDDRILWIGSGYGIAWIRNLDPAFVPYHTSFDETNNKIDHAVTLCAISDSTLYACGDDDLYWINTSTATVKKLGKPGYYFSVFPVINGYFIASANGNELQLFNKEFKPLNLLSVFPVLKPIKDDLLMCGTKAGDSLVFMASQNNHGLYIWDTKAGRLDSINTRTSPLWLLNDNINRLFIDSKQRLWIICENAISIYDHSKKQIDHPLFVDFTSKLPLSINMDVCELAGSFWITSYGTGVVKMSADLTIEKIYQAKDGINNLGVYKIFPVNDSQLVISSNNGLSILDSRTHHVKNYFIEDGLQSNSFEEASGDKKGNIIFLGGINGITRFDSRKLFFNKAIPRFTFSTISLSSQDYIRDTLNINLRKIMIPTNISHIRIGFSTINYSAPEKVQYAYRILEEQKEWSYTSQNFIQSFRLSPGTYHLQVKAFNEDGVASETRELVLVFLPRWYQTWWFKTILALIVAGVVYTIYRIRINQLKKEERIRSRLASDLHDDLGSTFNSIKVYSNLALMQPGNTDYLHKVKESTQDAINGIRDMIWVLDDKKDTVNDLFNRIQQFGAPLCEAEGIRFNANVDGGLGHHKLHKEEKRNLYLILKEAINNSVKYAQCTEISVTIKSTGNKLSITIADNGKGFDPDQTKQGNGLKNIPARAAEIGYRCSVNTSPGNGVTLRFDKT